MPTATPTVKRNPIPAGEHLLALVSVTETVQPSYNNPKEDAVRWIFQFKSKAVDPETGERYEFRQYTGPNYGHEKAALTILLDQMLPGWTTEQKEFINTDTILQTFYKGRIRHERPEKAGDLPKPRLAFIEPYQPAKPAPAAAPPPVAPIAAAPVVAAPPAEEEFDEFAGDDPFANMDN